MNGVDFRHLRRNQLSVTTCRHDFDFSIRKFLTA